MDGAFKVEHSHLHGQAMPLPGLLLLEAATIDAAHPGARIDAARDERDAWRQEIERLAASERAD